MTTPGQCARGRVGQRESGKTLGYVARGSISSTLSPTHEQAVEGFKEATSQEREGAT